MARELENTGLAGGDGKESTLLQGTTELILKTEDESRLCQVNHLQVVTNKYFTENDIDVSIDKNRRESMNQNRRNGRVAGRRPSPGLSQGERRKAAYPTVEGAGGRCNLVFLSASFFPLRVVGADMVGSGAPLRSSPGVMAARREVDWAT